MYQWYVLGFRHHHHHCCRRRCRIIIIHHPSYHRIPVSVPPLRLRHVVPTHTNDGYLTPLSSSSHHGIIQHKYDHYNNPYHHHHHQDRRIPSLTTALKTLHPPLPPHLQRPQSRTDQEENEFPKSLPIYHHHPISPRLIVPPLSYCIIIVVSSMVIKIRIIIITIITRTRKIWKNDSGLWNK